jgi:ABC-2 type transport system ATP-binding protein
LLILDEPTAGVDIEIRRSMWEFLRDINSRGVTIILTTHYLEEAENLCRHVAIIDEGQIIESDSIANVVAKLQTEVFVVTLRERLTAAPTLAGYAVTLRNEHEIEVEVAKGQGLNDVFAQLTAQSLHVASMRTKTNRLEELFMRLVENKQSGRAA